MRHRRFEPLGRDLSLLALGTSVYRNAGDDESLDLLDAWLEVGGTLVDTGREYGNAESVIARWLDARGVHDQVTVLTKGGHHDEQRRRVTPRDVAADLNESRAVLGLATIDLYLLHRDDPTQPVGPLLECLNEHREAARIRSFGASNWTTERLEEANAYAAAHGLTSFSCSSPALSLAQQNEPPWPDCVSASDPASRAWYESEQLPVFAWSSQAGGYFTNVANPDLTRVYESDDNRERFRRATELARTKGCSANHIALAWVLHQPFPSYAVIGPRTVGELRDSAAAVDIELTPHEWSWLALEELYAEGEAVRV
ncbi:MAG: aldo/keto reductase [Gaiellaceae bacterium]